MKIRSLLLGSAAAMVAVSGAQAADAVVVEAEPVEYVRICDAYGSGFFYIPGTETCLNINGYVRSHYVKEDETNDANVSDDNVLWAVRARLNFDARNETDWGTLRSQIRLQGSEHNGDGISTAVTGTTGPTTANHTHPVQGGVELDRALISIGGFRIGLADNYWTTNHGYGGANWTQGLGINVFDDGNYGFSNNIFMDYTFAADAFAFTVGVEDRGENVSNSGGTDGQGNFYAGVNYSGDWGGAAFTYAHDDNSTVLNRGDAYKASVMLNLADMIPGGSFHAIYRWEDLDNEAASAGHTAYVGADSVLQLSFNMDLTDDLGLTALYVDTDNDTIGTGTNLDGTQWTVGLSWRPVTGLNIFGSYTSAETENQAGVTQAEYDSFVIGVVRSF